MTNHSEPKKGTEDAGSVRLPSVAVEFKLPLPWLLAGAVAVLWGVVQMYFQLQSVSENVKQLQADVKVNNATTMQFAVEQALIRQRVEKLERDKERFDRSK